MVWAASGHVGDEEVDGEVRRGSARSAVMVRVRVSADDGLRTEGAWKIAANRTTEPAAEMRWTVDEPVEVAGELQALLDELCVRLGFCLPPQAQTRLRQTLPPFDVDEFTDAVFVAEGLDPRLEKTLRRQVRQRVEHHLVAVTARLHGDPLGT